METINKINKINELCLQIQELNLASVFTRYAGHTDQVSVTLYPGGWSADYPDKQIIFLELFFDLGADKIKQDLEEHKLDNSIETFKKHNLDKKNEEDVHHSYGIDDTDMCIKE